MKISQKLDYACRAAVCLAKHYDRSAVVKLEDISQREDISSSFLVQILNELKRSGIVESKRGKAGGYALSRNPASISLGDLVAAIEPGLVEIPSDSPGASGPAVSTVWRELSQRFDRRLRDISLEVIASETEAPMYHI